MIEVKQFVRNIGPVTNLEGQITSISDVDAQIAQQLSIGFVLTHVLGLQDFEAGSAKFPRVMYVFEKYAEEE